MNVLKFNSFVILTLNICVVKIGDCSGSESYNEEDSSKTPTDDDNGTHLYGVGEEEEEAELWRQMAFAQESSKVGYFLYIDQQFLYAFLSVFSSFFVCLLLGNGRECTRQRSQTNRRL